MSCVFVSLKSNLFIIFFIAWLGAVSFWAALKWHSVVSYHLHIWKVAWGDACQISHHHLGPISLPIFPSQLKFDGNFVLLSSWFWQGEHYKIYTWHDSCAVVSCVKICCNLMVSNWITAKRNFHWTWIVSKKKKVREMGLWSCDLQDLLRC